MATKKNNLAALSLALVFAACGGDSGNSPSQPTSENSQKGGSTYNTAKSSLTDSRDGKTYRTVTIGDQTWMAENLNYEMDGSFCYDDDPANCAKYGRLYAWNVSKTACPTGWHLPTKDDWWTLFDLVNVTYPDSAKWALLAKGYEKWPKAFDVYGFSVLPAGIRGVTEENDIGYMDETKIAYFQMSTSACKLSCDLVCLGDSCAASFLPNNDPDSDALSIRCLKDDDPLPPETTPMSSENNSEVDYETLKDERDGKTYKTVKIGNQVWMAENLNYEVEKNSYCYKNSADSCAKYGRLYAWVAAVGKSEEECGKVVSDDTTCWLSGGRNECGRLVSNKTCGLTGVVRGVCPEGWHLPDTSEWNKLYSAVGNDPYAIQAKGMIEWPDATDAYGFSVLITGYYDGSGYRSSGGGSAFFWSATEADDKYGHGASGAYYWGLYEEISAFSTVYKDYGYSVRCLKD